MTETMSKSIEKIQIKAKKKNPSLADSHLIGSLTHSDIPEDIRRNQRSEMYRYVDRRASLPDPAAGSGRRATFWRRRFQREGGTTDAERMVNTIAIELGSGRLLDWWACRQAAVSGASSCGDHFLRQPGPARSWLQTP